MNDQSQMMNQAQMMSMSQPQMMNQPQLMNQAHMLLQSQAMNQQAYVPPPQRMKQAQPMMSQSQPAMMNRGGYQQVWLQPQPPGDASMNFQGSLKPNFVNPKQLQQPGRSNWNGKKDKRKDSWRMERPMSPPTSISGGPSSSGGYQPPALHELQFQNRLKAKKFYPKKKFNNRFAPYAPRNTTSFIIRAKKSGGIASLVSPCPVTPAVLPTPIFSPSREVLGDMAKEEWGVDGYGSMKGLIRLRSPGNEGEMHDEEDEEEGGGGGSSESDVEEHVEVERRLDHDLSRFEMIYPNYGVDYNNVLENRVDDQDSHIAQLEEENLTLKERLFLMERELGDLRRRLQVLERQNQVVEDVNEEVVENGSENESEGGSDAPDMGAVNNNSMVEFVAENVGGDVTNAPNRDNVVVAEKDVCMEESVQDGVISDLNEIEHNKVKNKSITNAKKNWNEEGARDEVKSEKLGAEEKVRDRNMADEVVIEEGIASEINAKEEDNQNEVLCFRSTSEGNEVSSERKQQ